MEQTLLQREGKREPASQSGPTSSRGKLGHLGPGLLGGTPGPQERYFFKKVPLLGPRLSTKTSRAWELRLSTEAPWTRLAQDSRTAVQAQNTGVGEGSNVEVRRRVNPSTMGLDPQSCMIRLVRRRTAGQYIYIYTCIRICVRLYVSNKLNACICTHVSVYTFYFQELDESLSLSEPP